MRKQRGYSRGTQGRLAPARPPAPREHDVWKRPKREPETGWIVAGVVVLALVTAWLVVPRVLGGDGGAGRTAEPSASVDVSPTPGRSGSTGPRAGSQTAVFPRPAVGTRLELKVVSLGDHPEACTAEGLRIGGDLRTVYHHDCAESAAGPGAYFFFVRLTNTTDGPALVSLTGFALTTASGGAKSPLQGSAAGGGDRRFSANSALGPGASAKGWVTFDGSSDYRPASLTYVDGKEILTVRFPDAWA